MLTGSIFSQQCSAQQAKNGNCFGVKVSIYADRLNEDKTMRINSIFLAAVMIFGLAGQAAEARDHHGWRFKQKVNVNRGLHRGWYNNNRNFQAWNYNPYAYGNSPTAAADQYALQQVEIMNRNYRNNLHFNNGYWNRYWY